MRKSLTLVHATVCRLLTLFPVMALLLYLMGLVGCKKKEQDSPSGGGGSGGGQIYAGTVKAHLNGRLVQFEIPTVLSFTDPPTLSLGGTTYAGQDTFILTLQFRIPTSRSDTSYIVSGDERGAHLQIQYRGRTNSDIYAAPYSARNRFARLNMEEIRINGNLVQGKFSGVAYNTELASTVDSIRVTAGEFQARR